MTNELNKAELRRLAEAAMPGDWFKAGNLLCFDVKTGESHGLNVEDDRFIASASPAAVLSLLDQCDGLMAQHARDSVELRELCQARDDAKKERDAAFAEREELRRLLDCFVKGESDPDENQSERHMYVTEAQSLLAHTSGKIKAHTLVPDEVLRNQSAELEACRKDAERYQWLRDPCSGAEHVVLYSRGDFGRGLMSHAMLDAAIDAELAKESRQ